MKKLKGVAVGAGYFSQFHFEAWQRMSDVELTAICDLDRQRAALAVETYGVANSYDDPAEMLDAERPDFVDIITRPDAHLDLVNLAVSRGVPIICQKPLAPTLASRKTTPNSCAM